MHTLSSILAQSISLENNSHNQLKQAEKMSFVDNDAAYEFFKLSSDNFMKSSNNVTNANVCFI